MKKSRAKRADKAQPDAQSKLAKLEALWCRLSGPWQAKIDAGQSLNLGEKQMLRKTLTEWWHGAGIREAESWSMAEKEMFMGRITKLLAAWAATEASGGLFTLEDFKEQVKAFGAWQVLEENASAAMSEVELRSAKRRKESEARRTPTLPNKTSAVFIYTSEKLGMDFLALPVRERARQARAQGFSNAWAARQKRYEIQQQRELEIKAKSMLVPWRSLTPQDYEFRTRVEQLDDYDLQLAVLYEYARESDKFRGLLSVGLCLEKSGGSTSDRFSPDCREAFAGIDVESAQRSPLGRWFFVLQILAKELIDNMPFAALKPDRIKQAIYHILTKPDGRKVPFGCRLDDELVGYYRYPAPVTLASAIEKQEMAASKAIAGGRRDWLKDHDGKDYGETLTITVNWRNYSNSELVEHFQNVLTSLRPKKTFPEPKPRQRPGKGKVNRRALYEALDNLASMRLLTHCKKEDEAHQLFKGIKSNPTRRDHFKALGKRARKNFSECFAFGEPASNHGRW